MKAIQKLKQRQIRANSLLCVGLDGEIAKLPENFQTEKYPQFAFNKWIIAQTHEFVSTFKPNLAFYEAAGDLGVKELKMTIEYLQEHHPDIFLIADAKRGDIGSTNNGYVKSIFDWYGFDAVTLHPYLGQEALKPFLDREDKVSIILCRTSNPGAGEFQDLEVDGKPLWSAVAKKVVNHWNTKENCMMVVGATYPAEMAAVRSEVGEMTFLVPGIGTQGGSIKSVMNAGLNKEKNGLIVSSSRSVIFSKNPSEEARKLRDEINIYRI